VIKKKPKEPTWNDVKTSIKHLDPPALLNLLKDLYQLSKANKSFLHARFSIGDNPLQFYKKIIEDALYPDVFDKKSDFDFEGAGRAINEYSKATGDPQGIADLMIYYVEKGNKFTLDYGDIDEGFYDALVEMYGKAIKKVFELPQKTQDAYRHRLKKIMKSSDGIGWGYHDGLEDSYFEAFQE
jgi:hypothetical protein